MFNKHGNAMSSWELADGSTIKYQERHGIGKNKKPGKKERERQEAEGSTFRSAVPRVVARTGGKPGGLFR
ncbi:hypothetical protein MTO96_023476 [Rhipicephalus appendiculatus]